MPADAPQQAALERLTRFAPFDRMEPQHLLWLAERLQPRAYAKGELVQTPGSGPADSLFIIRRGIIHGEQDVTRAQENAAWLELHEGECFPLGALIARRGVTSSYRAGSDAECLLLPAADFHRLLQLSPPFHDFCTRRIANLLEQSKQIIMSQYAQTTSEQQTLSSPLSRIIRREPVSCSPDTPLRQVLANMHKLRIGAMVAVDDHRKPIGIFTLNDLLARVAGSGCDLDAPLSEAMTPNPCTLPPHALAHEAALVMARHGFRHILIEENGRLAGLISEKDLFSLQRVRLREISNLIRNAQDIATLKGAASDIRQLAHNMLAQGIAAEQLTQIISTLNDLLTSRIIELERALDSAADAIEFCWLALGSEGRLEQTLNTDQDNGILFALPEGEDAGEVRRLLLPFAKRINEALAECGFPLCHGEIMASNPKWCLSLEEWQETFSTWIHRGDAQVLMHSSIFFDFRPLYGQEELAHRLREWLNHCIADNRQFLKLMAINALGRRPPLGIVRDFVLDSDG
ncbi:MAG: prohead protease, partial [Gammaproteobacteria bacterium RIFOXYA12_FULL_61_12]